MRIKLVTFSDGSKAFRAAGRRLVAEADSTGWFSSPSEHWTIETLRSRIPEFYAEHEKFIVDHPKGYGLWIWKPAILSHLIDLLEDGEMVLLLDAGCQFNCNQNSWLRFQQYIDLCTTSDLLVMQLADGSFGFDNLTDAAWTKLSVLNSLDPQSIFRNTNQIQSGIIFATKSEKSQRVAKKWLRSCLDSDYSFLLDPLDTDPQPDKFVQHRWEQSILSLIVKSEGIQPLVDETYFYPNWNEGLDFPIWAMRNRSGGNAFRRNFLDILRLLAARVERFILSVHRYKN
jgi:hypothetical protein